MALGILCPGQGGQTPDMLNILAGAPGAAAVLDTAAGILGVDLRRLVAEPGADLHRNAVAQPLLCATQLATFAALRPDLPPVRAFAGYSVGELAAYGCAGAVNAADLVGLAVKRARAMDEACPRPQGLLAVRGLDRSTVDALCAAHGADVAIANDVDRFVVGGDRHSLAAVEAAAVSLGAGVTPLSVSVASHTRLMTPAVERFADDLAGSPLRAPLTPVLAGIDGAPVRRRDHAIKALSAQLARTVEWAACVDAMVEMGCSVLLELGPGAALSRMIRDRHPTVGVRAVADFRTLSGVAKWAELQVRD
jgi:[acyl-carrier-protein] S-malonyltransferase